MREGIVWGLCCRFLGLLGIGLFRSRDTDGDSTAFAANQFASGMIWNRQYLLTVQIRTHYSDDFFVRHRRSPKTERMNTISVGVGVNLIASVEP